MDRKKLLEILLSSHDKFIEFRGRLKVAHASQTVTSVAISLGHVAAVVLFVGCGGSQVFLRNLSLRSRLPNLPRALCVGRVPQC